jgi:hypothetical protein
MGLIMNTYRESVMPVTHFGGLTLAPEFANFNSAENWFVIYIGEGALANQTSLPDSNYPPVTWRMPLKAGAISSRSRIIGSGDISASAHYGMPLIAYLTGTGAISSALGNLGMQILADISGSGGISSSVGSLLAQISAAISGNGGITEGELLSLINALADISGSGGITEGELTGLGDLIAILEGEGGIASTISGIAELAATIRSYGNLTPEGIRDAVWAAAASDNNEPGSMGEKVNDAGSAGNPWGSDTASNNTDGTFGKLVQDIKKIDEDNQALIISQK